ncbi:molecular chaperone [Haladaptatus sp. W1]|uniref:molecular chaperone TorD family protein n=1 Tax=Haladaptatus sp. W1 TaxID=1897478 RepID=UPI000849CAED|nr:molecular chaperone TorD family protein [Haladaptatus sp. W1]ODR82939.1 molecular chaperone [Haladaptatus sp. W1]
MDWLRDESIETSAAARGGVYALLARSFIDPDGEFYAALADGRLNAQLQSLLDASGLSVDAPSLTTDDDHDMLAARYNDLFVIGFSEVLDPTDGTVSSQDPPVPLYESTYRSEVSWNDVNLDLARAYEYFGVDVDESDRDNHDHIRFELEFMGYLCRREAAVDADVARARLDFLDRHLRVAANGVADRLADEPGTGFYGAVATLLERFTEADTEELAARLDGGGG